MLGAQAHHEFLGERVELVVHRPPLRRHPLLEAIESGDQLLQLPTGQSVEVAEPIGRAQLVEFDSKGMIAVVLNWPRWPGLVAEETIGEHLAQFTMQVAAGVDGSRVAVVTRPSDGVAGQIGAAVGHPPHVGHRVVDRLQLAAAATQLIDRHRLRSGRIGVRHQVPPDTGGRTATSSSPSTTVVGAAGSPLTQIRQVPRTSENAAP